MSIRVSGLQGLQPVLTFVTMIILGVVVARFLVQDECLRAPIIIFSFVMGMIIAAFELRIIINRNRMATSDPPLSMKEEDVKKRMARFVAELFDEDIPFDELEEKQNEGIDEINNLEK